jgi:adenylate kinase
MSGVGKTTMLANFAAGAATWRHIIASEILRQSVRQPDEALRLASKEQMIDNQRTIIEGVKQIQERSADRNILLDAHCVIDNDVELVTVPASVIEPLHPSFLICVVDDPINVLERRMSSGLRLRPQRTAAQLGIYQELVKTTCESYAKLLGIGFASVSATDAGAFAALIDSLESGVGHRNNVDNKT